MENGIYGWNIWETQTVCGSCESHFGVFIDFCKRWPPTAETRMMLDTPLNSFTCMYLCVRTCIGSTFRCIHSIPVSMPLSFSTFFDRKSPCLWQIMFISNEKKEISQIAFTLYCDRRERRCESPAVELRNTRRVRNSRPNLIFCKTKSNDVTFTFNEFSSVALQCVGFPMNATITSACCNDAAANAVHSLTHTHQQLTNTILIICSFMVCL